MWLCSISPIWVFAESRQETSYRIETRDARNFWEAYDSLPNVSDSSAWFQHKVINQASPLFRIYIRKWNITAAGYTALVRKFPSFFRSIRAHCLQLLGKESEAAIRKKILAFQSRYPNFKEADICVAVGNFSTGGNDDVNQNSPSIYVGLEFHGLPDSADIHEFPAQIQDYLSRSNFLRTVIHELVHVQQKTHGKRTLSALSHQTLGGRILSEGIAEYIAISICPEGKMGNFHVYGTAHEAELKQKLKTEFQGRDYKDWFGGNDAWFIHHPRDLGYFMGASIAKSYAAHCNNPSFAWKSLIEVKNRNRILKKSRYFSAD